MIVENINERISLLRWGEACNVFKFTGKETVIRTFKTQNVTNKI